MSASVIPFGQLTFDPASGVLRGADGDLRLGQRAVALLQTLIAADHQPVTKSTLLEAAWPGMIVEEGNLTVQIAALRKALGTRPDGQDWIVTVPRVGYRLLRPEPASTPTPELPTIPVLAVLPFANLSGDPEQDYFADGVVEDIITALSKFKSFAVIARNSSFTYKGRAVDVRQVAQELGVNYVVEGSVRRGGGKLRISAQLVDGATGVHVWAQSFDGPIEEVFDVQDRVTENVAALVAPRIQRAEIERARRERPGSLAAYDLYLQALPDLHSSLPAGNARAINLLERAIELDPGFAPALAAASEACLLKVAMQFPGAAEADAERAVELALAALALAGDDAMVLGYCGFVLIHMGSDYETGIAVLQRAIEENPNNATVLTCAGVGNLLGGDLGLAADYLQRALQLNPNSFETQWQLTGMAHIRMAEGRYAEALDWATRSQAVNSVYDANHWMLIAGNAHLGRLQEAHKYLAALEVLSPGVSLARIRRGQHAIDPQRIEVLIEGMRLAGMAEE